MIVFIISARAQVVYEPLDNDVYSFLDRLSSKGIIVFNDLVKPVSRKYIAGKIVEAGNKISMLNSLEKEELEFYKKDYFLGN